MIKTKIEYADSTINPTPTCSGCELYSDDPAENHCYAATLVRRYQGRKGWPQSFTRFELFPERIPRACNWPDLTGQERPGKPWLNGLPRIIFLNDIGDSFAPSAPLDWSLPYIETMAAAPHIWLWLTKWPHRMAGFFTQLGYVPANFWLGTTVTSQETVWRVGELLRLREMAKVLWVSLEPLLGPVDFDIGSYGSTGFWFDQIDLLCSGGESGTNARPSHPGWHRAPRDFCLERGIAYFHKQNGEWLHTSQILDEHIARAWESRRMEAGDGYQYIRVGKLCAGRQLDGRTWDQMLGEKALASKG